MEYETPNPGPCRRCGTRIWHSGGLCSDCSDNRNLAQTERDREHTELLRLRAALLKEEKT